MLTRAASRDLFDVFNLLAGGLEFDEKKLKKCFIFYFCLADDFRKLDAKIISEIDPIEIKKFLLPLLEKGRKVELDNVVEVVKEFASKMILLNESEQRYIDFFYEKKKADLSLLFEDVKYNTNLKNHPMLEWRLKNL